MGKHFSWVVVLASVVLVAVVLASPVGAHHGWEDYQDAEFEITGTLVTPISLAGPHATTQIRVDEDVWDVVLAPSPRTARAGLTEDVIPVGDTVTASGHRHNDPTTLEMKTERLTWNGTVFNVYPDRN